ncbi:MAG: serine hydrolase, partial [Flavobacteriales bacterium]
MKNLICLLLFLLHFGLFAQDHQLSKQIDSLIQSETSPAFNGIILITKKGKPVYEKVMGYSDFEKKTPLCLESEF